jgi:hypothetical protein
MADFLNQKQEVLTVELTKHGRKLLAMGTFQPEFYQFFDDSIIYDLSYGDTSEAQNNSQVRLLDEDLTIRALNLSEDINLAPLGKSSLSSDYAPSWNLNILNGNIKIFVTSSNLHEKEFDLGDIKYVLSLEKTNVSNIQNFNFSTLELEDGRIIKIDDDYILIDLKEENVEDEYENFTIEIETYDELAGGIEGGLEKKLKFLPKQSNIIDGIIYNENELPNRFADIKLTKEDVEFYLDVLVDQEIDQNIINKTAKPVQEQVRATYTTTFEGVTKENC